MKTWVAQAKELLGVLGQHPTSVVQTAEARGRFKEILEGADDSTYVVMHYKAPRAVVMSVEAFEAMRRMALLVSGMVESAERQDETEPAAEETTVSAEEWGATVTKAVKAARQAPKSERRFRKRPAKAV